MSGVNIPFTAPSNFTVVLSNIDANYAGEVYLCASESLCHPVPFPKTKGSQISMTFYKKDFITNSFYLDFDNM